MFSSRIKKNIHSFSEKEKKKDVNAPFGANDLHGLMYC